MYMVPFRLCYGFCITVKGHQILPAKDLRGALEVGASVLGSKDSAS